MSEQKREKFTATTPEKTRPQQPKVRLEGKLTEAQLEAITGGGIETLTSHEKRGSGGG